MSLIAKITGVEINEHNLEVIKFEIRETSDPNQKPFVSKLDIEEACFLAEGNMTNPNSAYGQLIRAFANHTYLDGLINREFQSL